MVDDIDESIHKTFKKWKQTFVEWLEHDGAGLSNELFIDEPILAEL